MVPKFDKDLEFEDIIELNTYWIEEQEELFKNPKLAGKYFFKDSPCFFCKEDVSNLVKATSRDGTVVHNVYLRPYNRLRVYSSTMNYRAYAVIGTIEDVKQYLMHAECLEKYKIVP